MRINSFKIITPLLLVLSTSNVMANNSSGTINFNGEILSTSCTLLTQNINVELPKINKTDLPKLNMLPKNVTSKNSKPFEIILQDCGDNNKTVDVTLKSNKVMDRHSHIMLNLNTSPSAAKDVGITINVNELENKESIKLDGSKPLTKKIIDKKAIYKFTANYVSTGNNPTSGIVTTQATFDIVYK